MVQAIAVQEGRSVKQTGVPFSSTGKGTLVRVLREEKVVNGMRMALCVCPSNVKLAAISVYDAVHSKVYTHYVSSGSYRG